MSVLGVNLKHLYQRRSMWLVYLVLGLFVFSFRGRLGVASVGKGHFIVPVAVQFLVGFYAASMPVQILAKPFSYCLPGHRAVPRKFVFLVGIATSLLCSLIFGDYSRSWWPWTVLTCAIFCAGLTVYLIGAAVVFGVRNASQVLGLAVWIFFGAALLNLHVVAERFVVEYPLVIVALGLACGTAVWRWLGGTDWSQRFCAVSRLGMLDVWDCNKMRQYSRKQAADRWDKLENHPEPWVEQLFLSRMKNCDHRGPGRCIWGAVYTKYAMALSCWKKTLPGWLIGLALVLCLCYWQPEGTCILLLMAGGMAVNVRLPVHSDMAIPGGRNERFLTAIVLAGSLAALVTAVLAIFVAVTMVLAPLMPEIGVRGVLLSFQAMSLQLLVVPTIVVPMALALRLIIFRYPYSTFASISVVGVLVFVFGVLRSGILERLLDPALFAGLFVVGWLALVLALRHICMRRSLVGQSRNA